jgi:hypothetical protein
LLVGAGALASVRKTPEHYSVRAPRSLRDSDREPTVEELAADFREFRAEVAQLTPDDQREVWDSLQQGTRSLAEQTLYTFFALPEDEQQAIIDRTIDRSEARRRAWQEFNGNGYPGGPPDAGRWPIREVSDTPDYRTFEELNLEERLALRRDLWNDATPQAHAMRAEFFRLSNERRKARGLPESFPFRRFG